MLQSVRVSVAQGAVLVCLHHSLALPLALQGVLPRDHIARLLVTNRLQEHMLEVTEELTGHLALAHGVQMVSHTGGWNLLLTMSSMGLQWAPGAVQHCALVGTVQGPVAECGLGSILIAG